MFRSKLALAALLLAAAAAVTAQDLDTNAIAPLLLGSLGVIAPLDPPYIMRTAAAVTAGFFDAWAPYHPTAVGLLSRLPRAAEEERTARNKNTAAAYATARVLAFMHPELRPTLDGIISSYGLDPADQSRDATTAVGRGNSAADAVIARFAHDGMNQLGDLDRKFNRINYSDHTGYAPVNSAYELSNPSRWQPAIKTNRQGVFTVQQHVAIQLGGVRGLAVEDLSAYTSPAPAKSNYNRNRRAYRQQARDVADAVAALATNDTAKVLAEWFESKIDSLAVPIFHVLGSRGLNTVDDFIQLDFLYNLALFDASRAVWNQKRVHDAVRPFSAIRKVFEDTDIESWGGRGAGRVTMKGRDFESYLSVGAHSEYPSGSACFCAAQSQAHRNFFGGDDDLRGLTVTFPAGSSKVEPGITPASDVTVVFNTLTAFQDACGRSRVDAGVHFQDAVDQGRALCTRIGDAAYAKFVTLIDGTAPAPSDGGSDDHDGDHDGEGHH